MTPKENDVIFVKNTKQIIVVIKYDMYINEFLYKILGNDSDILIDDWDETKYEIV